MTARFLATCSAAPWLSFRRSSVLGAPGTRLLFGGELKTRRHPSGLARLERNAVRSWSSPTFARLRHLSRSCRPLEPSLGGGRHGRGSCSRIGRRGRSLQLSRRCRPLEGLWWPLAQPISFWDGRFRGNAHPHRLQGVRRLRKPGGERLVFGVVEHREGPLGRMRTHVGHLRVVPSPITSMGFGGMGRPTAIHPNGVGVWGMPPHG